MRLLGRGALSAVWLEDDDRRRGGDSVARTSALAIKATRKSLLVTLRVVDAAIREKLALEAVGVESPFVARLRNAAQSEDTVLLRMDAVLWNGQSAMSLRRLVQHAQLPRPSACCVATCLMSAVAHLHERGVAHRDIKPDNVCVSADGACVLVDFGAARCFPPDERSMSLVGTVAYLAPEMVTRRGHGCEVDWWSLGIVLAEALSGEPPFAHASSHAELAEALESARASGGASLEIEALGAQPSTGSSRRWEGEAHGAESGAESAQSADLGAKLGAELGADMATEACDADEGGGRLDLQGLLPALLTHEPIARAAAARRWLATHRANDSDHTEAVRVGGASLLAHARAAASADAAAHGEVGSPSPQDDVDEEEMWAREEREALLERADANWRRTAEQWQTAFAEYGRPYVRWELAQT